MLFTDPVHFLPLPGRYLLHHSKAKTASVLSIKFKIFFIEYPEAGVHDLWII